MNTGTTSQNESVTALRERDARSEPPARSRRAEELFAAVAAALQTQVPAPPPPPPPQDANGELTGTDVAERWRPTGGALTAPTAHTGATGTGGTDAGGESRIVARVETKDLGSVCVVVDRSAGGMKVWLAMDNATAVGHAQAEREALVQALESLGLTVASLSVTRLGEGGISFAQVRDAHEAQLAEGSDGSEAADGKPEARSRRRLNLVG